MTSYMIELRRLCHEGDPQKNHDRLEELVNLINALIMPRAWIGIDSQNHVHLTLVAKQSDPQIYAGTPAGLRYSAHFIWDYHPWSDTYTCEKRPATTYAAEAGEVYYVPRPEIT